MLSQSRRRHGESPIISRNPASFLWTNLTKKVTNKNTPEYNCLAVVLVIIKTNVGHNGIFNIEPLLNTAHFYKRDEPSMSKLWSPFSFRRVSTGREVFGLKFRFESQRRWLLSSESAAAARSAPTTTGSSSTTSRRSIRAPSSQKTRNSWTRMTSTESKELSSWKMDSTSGTN